MSKSAKEIWEEIAEKAKDTEAVTKAIDSLEAVEKLLLDLEEKPFRLPYSSPPKTGNRTWK